VVIPAWNEEGFLPRLLDSLDAARARYHGGPDAIEVIVADNASTDRTAEVAAKRGCRVARVERRRIACSRNGGAAIARGEVLCFVDADYRIHAESFNAIDAAMQTGRYVGGATGARLERCSPGIGATMLAIVPMVALLGVDAGVWFCRREDFDAVGGYDESVPVSEDVRFLMALKKLGKGRRPRQTLARLSSWGSFWRTFRPPRGVPAPASFDEGHVRAIVSCRKFDQHGDWHFLKAALAIPFYSLFARRRFDAIVNRYWYDGR
jgi:glycosyltransferase involved in cell wall biosynthesis